MIAPQVSVAAIALVAVVLMMLAEMLLSRHNERTLRAAGAIEPRDDVGCLPAEPGSHI